MSNTEKEQTMTAETMAWLRERADDPEIVEYVASQLRQPGSQAVDPSWVAKDAGHAAVQAFLDAMEGVA